MSMPKSYAHVDLDVSPHIFPCPEVTLTGEMLIELAKSMDGDQLERLRKALGLS
jgi:hypothetical protein